MARHAEISLMDHLFEKAETGTDLVAQLCHEYFKGFPQSTGPQSGGPECASEPGSEFAGVVSSAPCPQKCFGAEVLQLQQLLKPSPIADEATKARRLMPAVCGEPPHVLGPATERATELAASPDIVTVREPASLGKQQETTRAGGSSSDETALTLQNLPVDYSHEKTRFLLDELGFRDRYDVVIWFARKLPRSLTHAIVNFKTPSDCASFRKRVSEQPLKLSGEQMVTPGESSAQGFHELFMKYWHVTQKSTNVVGPFFDSETLQAMPPQAFLAATRNTCMANPKCTTLVIRNIPESISRQEDCLVWLQSFGDFRGYDFFLFFPKKARAGRMAYAFVNFCRTSRMQACLESLRGYSARGCDPLNVVVAKEIQGLEACKKYFMSIIQQGSLRPIVRNQEVAQAEAPPRASNQYQ